MHTALHEKLKFQNYSLAKVYLKWSNTIWAKYEIEICPKSFVYIKNYNNNNNNNSNNNNNNNN